MNWIILQPIPLEFEMDEDGTVIVSDITFPCHGDGGTPEKAMGAWWKAVTEFYMVLENDADKNEANAQYLDYFRQYIQPKNMSAIKGRHD